MPLNFKKLLKIKKSELKIFIKLIIFLPKKSHDVRVNTPIYCPQFYELESELKIFEIRKFVFNKIGDSNSIKAFDGFFVHVSQNKVAVKIDI